MLAGYEGRASTNGAATQKQGFAHIFIMAKGLSCKTHWTIYLMRDCNALTIIDLQAE
jgi:hypothetical protein